MVFTANKSSEVPSESRKETPQLVLFEPMRVTGLNNGMKPKMEEICVLCKAPFPWSAIPWPGLVSPLATAEPPS